MKRRGFLAALAAIVAAPKAVQALEAVTRRPTEAELYAWTRGAGVASLDEGGYEAPAMTPTFDGLSSSTYRHWNAGDLNKHWRRVQGKTAEGLKFEVEEFDLLDR